MDCIRDKHMREESIALLGEVSIALLKELIRIPSFSREEAGTANLMAEFLTSRGVQVFRKGNNVWAFNRYFDPDKPTILLNSHHDTVKPNAGYTRDPFSPDLVGGRLYGLGSNDAGGCLVSLTAAFLYFERKEKLRYNLCFAATAEEEISGRGGIESILPELGDLDFAIVGEPTLLQMAVAEKGLMVLDAAVQGASGHAARDEGDNAIYKAIEDIRWFERFRFPLVSDMTGPVKMSVTMIQAGSQHNVVPASCTYVVDIRINEFYTHEELLSIIREHVHAEVMPRSTRLKSSFIPLDHPIVQAGLSLGLNTYGSPTMSDQALLSIPSLKIGPGDSARSHSADEFVEIQEIQAGIELYAALLGKIL